jgi:N-acetylglucosamine kinase-like BadF-type ATPase
LRYYIGIDGGGTKTSVCAASLDDSTLLYAKTGGSSWRELGPEKVANKLFEVVDKLVSGNHGQIAGMAMGLPCYGESTGGDRLLEQAVRECFPKTPIYFTNDVEVGWAGSMALEPGINVVAGTGAIAFGKDIHGKTARCGGWSEFFGDEGSCYWVGRKLMELFSKQSDGRMSKDPLYEIVRSELKLDEDFSFIDLVYNEYATNRKQVAGLQLLALKAAQAGSPSAKMLYKEAVDEILLLVNGIRLQLDFTERPWTVSYTGGLFKAEEFVLLQFGRAIEKEGGKLSAPRFEPVEGAVLLAFQQFMPEGLAQIQKIMTEKKP